MNKIYIPFKKGWTKDMIPNGIVLIEDILEVPLPKGNWVFKCFFDEGAIYYERNKLGVWIDKLIDWISK